MRGMVVAIFLHIKNSQQIESGIGVDVEAGRKAGRSCDGIIFRATWLVVGSE